MNKFKRLSEEAEKEGLCLDVLIEQMNTVNLEQRNQFKYFENRIKAQLEIWIEDVKLFIEMEELEFALKVLQKMQDYIEMEETKL